VHQVPARRTRRARRARRTRRARRRRGARLVEAGSLGAAAEQGDRAAGIAAVSVGQPDRDLGEALPQVALMGWAGLP